MLSIFRWLPNPSVAAFSGALLLLSSSLQGQISGGISGSTGAAIIATELVVNGGFETGASTTLPIGGTAVGGGNAPLILGTLASWDVGVAGSGQQNALATNQTAYFATISEGAPAGGGPRTGTVAAVLPNTMPYDGYISQPIVGVRKDEFYRISFYLSNQTSSSFLNTIDVKWGGTATSGGPIQNGLSLSGGSPSIPGSISVWSGTGPAWTRYQFDVAAPSDNARLSFIGGGDSGILIDDVSVVLIPEATTLIMLSTGMLLVSLRRIRRDRAA